MPEPKYEAEHRELHRVIAAVDQKQPCVAALEQVIDAEAGRHPAQAGRKPCAECEAQRGLWSEEHREHVRRDQREHESATENERWLAGSDLRVAQSRRTLPHPAEYRRRIPQSA